MIGLAALGSLCCFADGEYLAVFYEDFSGLEDLGRCCLYFGRPINGLSAKKSPGGGQEKSK